MPQPLFYLGTQTGRRYAFWRGVSLPAVLADPYGGPLSQGTWLNEQVIQCNADGSVARGTAGPNTVDVYSPATVNSLWEQSTVYPEPPQPTGVGLPVALPAALGV